MYDRSDEFVSPQFKAVILKVSIKQGNMPGEGGVKKQKHLMA